MRKGSNMRRILMIVGLIVFMAAGCSEDVVGPPPPANAYAKLLGHFVGAGHVICTYRDSVVAEYDVRPVSFTFYQDKGGTAWVQVRLHFGSEQLGDTAIDDLTRVESIEVSGDTFRVVVIAPQGNTQAPLVFDGTFSGNSGQGAVTCARWMMATKSAPIPLSVSGTWSVSR